MDVFIFREIATNAVRYWERRRIVYNAVLAVVVAGYFVPGLPGTMRAVTLDHSLGLFALAVVADILYCAAYVPDVFAQFSRFGRSGDGTGRWCSSWDAHLRRSLRGRS